MVCEIHECCRFFTDHMQELPKTAEYIRNRLCFGDHGKCKRFRIYKEFGKGSVPDCLDPDDLKAVEKALLCLRTRSLHAEQAAV